MRIRNRFPPSSFSSPPHLSDPQLLPRFRAVQHPVHGGAQSPPPGRPLAREGISRTSPPPSDPPNQRPNQPPAIRRGSARWVSEVNRQKALEGEEGEEERLEDDEERSKRSRKGSILCAQAGAGHLPPTASPHQEERVERLVPPKKRRGSFERSRQGDETAITMEEEEKKEIKPEAKSKRSKKSGGNNGAGGGKKKPRVRGNEIMEGSRCSRVNGRGWRCCQPTLVGYSLCEHHLGKGRLRSMGSVPSSAAIAAAPASLPALEDGRRDGNDDDEEEEEEEQEKPATMRKKRVKLGMVKARSISSLLGQTNNAVVAAAAAATCDDDK